MGRDMVTNRVLTNWQGDTIVLQKTTGQFQIKFIIYDYLQMYKTLQLFTNTFTFNTNIFASIRLIKNTCAHIQSY
jgi:hypothetical protein